MEKQNVERRNRILIDAVIKQDYTTVKYLLQNGYNVNCVDSEGNSPLHHAIMMENLRIIELLLQYNADVQLKNKYRSNPYDYAVKSDNFNILKIILQNKEEIPLHSCIKLKKYPEDLKKLFYKKVMLKSTDYKGFTALHYAVECNDLNGVRMLISRGVDVSGCTHDNKLSPLHLATSECIKLLLQKFAIPHITSNYLFSPLGEIAMKRRLRPFFHVDREEKQKIIEILFRNGADCVEVVERVQSGYSASTDGLVYLLKFMALLEHEHHYARMNRLRLNYDNLLGSFYKQCLEEVVRLQGEKISDYISYYDFAIKNVQELSKYINNKSILKAFENKLKITSEFPIYNEILIRNFNDAVKERKLRETACSSLCCVIPYINPGHVATYKILNFLETEDKKNLIDAFESAKLQNNTQISCEENS